MKLRPEVKWFAEKMEAKLLQNDHKRGWQEESMPYLNGRLRQEILELERALYPSLGRSVEDVISEAADVANFAMMIADIANAKRRTKIPAEAGKDPPEFNDIPDTRDEHDPTL